MAPFAGYTRVSRVGDRTETLLSPRLQQEQIQAWAAGHSIEVEMLSPELDASGGDNGRPILQDAIARVERGELAGIVVARLDRLSRSVAGGLEMLERIEAVGGQVRSVAEQLDPSTPDGRMTRNILISVAQHGRDQKTAEFHRAKADAVDRGIHISGRVPRGYRRRADRRLELDPAVAPAVREAFELRALDTSWGKIAERLGDRLGRPITPSAAAYIVRNPVYRGEARQGELRNPDAHPAIVDRALWEAAQLEHPRPPRGEASLLQGLVRCAGCKRRMTIAGRRFYACRRRHATGRCTEPAMISAGPLEEVVERTVLAHLEGMQVEARQRTDLVEATQRQLAEAEAELVAYQEAVSAAEVGANHFAAGMDTRVEAVESAQSELGRAHVALSSWIVAEVREIWPELGLEKRRHALRGALGVVWVRRGRGNLAGRVRLVAAGFEGAELSVRGTPGPIEPLEWVDDLEGEIPLVGVEDLGEGASRS